MSEVYIVIKTFGNSVDSWDNIIGVYEEKQAADDACAYLKHLWTTQVVDGSSGYFLDYAVETHQVIDPTMEGSNVQIS